MYISEYNNFLKEYSPKFSDPSFLLGKIFCTYFNLDIKLNKDIYLEKDNDKANVLIINRYVIH